MSSAFLIYVTLHHYLKALDNLAKLFDPTGECGFKLVSNQLQLSYWENMSNKVSSTCKLSVNVPAKRPVCKVALRTASLVGWVSTRSAARIHSELVLRRSGSNSTYGGGEGSNCWLGQLGLEGASDTFWFGYDIHTYTYIYIHGRLM